MSTAYNRGNPKGTTERVDGSGNPYDTWEISRRKCTYCGGWGTVSTFEYGLCRKCLNADNGEDKTARQDGHHLYVVQSCPHNAIKPGARYAYEEWASGLKLGTWPLGMVIKVLSSGNRPEVTFVVGGEGKYYRPGQEPDVLPPQRAIKIS